MSIKKIDFNRVRQAHKLFTGLLNDVIQNIHDGFTLGVYTYLSSLPPEWNINKQHLQNHFGVGRDKIGKTLTWLKDNFLITHFQERNADGTLGDFSVVVEDGFLFLENIINKQDSLTDALKTRIAVPTGVLKSRTPVKPDTGKSAPIEEIYLNKEIKKKRRERAPIKAVASSLSDSFKPDQKREAFLQETAQRVGTPAETILAKFVAWAKKNGIKSLDWQAELESFTLKERPAPEHVRSGNNGKSGNAEQVRPAILDIQDPRHPDYERVKRLEARRNNMTRKVTHGTKTD